MSKLTVHYCNPAIIFLAVLLLFTQCKNFNDAVPFPGGESEFAQPVSKPFKFSDARPIKWEVVHPDSIKPLTEKKFDFNKLPSKPFDIGEPQPLLKPMDEQKFDWNSLPDTAFNLDRLPTQKLKFKTALLGTPKVIKAGLPNVKQGAARGIMEVGITMGLPGSGRCFMTDNQGQLWIGTDKGLCRYNGENLVIYAADQGLSDDNITSIIEDSQGHVWVGTNNGEVFIIDSHAGLVKQLADTFGRGSSWGMMMDKEGQIWIVRNGSGIYIINTKKETVKEWSAKEGLLNNGTIKILQDNRNLIWVTTGAGINVVDIKAGKTKRIKKANGLNSNFFVCLMQDKEDRIWLGGDGGINIIDLAKGTIKLLWKDQGILPANFMSGLMQDKEGTIWIGSGNGMAYAFDEKSGRIERLKIVVGAGNIVYSFLEDKQGQIWMGTVNTGCVFLNRNNGRPGNFSKADGLGDNSMWSIKEDGNGNIWIGSRGGVDIYNPISKTIKHLGKEQGLLNEVNTNLLVDSKGRIWIGGNNSGISIIDIKRGTIKYLGKEQGLSGAAWASLLEDKKAQIWVASTDGEVQIVNPDEKSIKRISNAPELKNNRIDKLAEDSNGEIWIAITGGGVDVIDKDGKTIKNVNTSQKLINNLTTTFMEDSKGNMWIGTQKGIDVADLKNNTLTSFTTNEGLASNGIWTLDEKNGNIYVGTSLGLTILTPSLKENNQKPIWKATSYGKSQGLTYVDFAENSSYFSKSGQLWAGVDNQILTIIDEAKTDTVVLLPYICGINIMDKPQFFYNRDETKNQVKNIDTLWKTDRESFYPNKELPKDTGYLQKNKIRWNNIEGPYHLPVNLRLPYNQNYLSFNFTGNHISNPDKVKYRYLLEGIDKNWSPASDKNFSENYRDLPPGNYIFKVSSKGMNGLWSAPAEFKFTITPPWWKTWWAYTLYVFFFISIVGIYIQYRSGALKKHNQQLEEKVMNRTNELRKSLNDLREAQNQLIQSEKMASLGELTAGIAHEIQNPLNFVNNFSEISVELADEIKTGINKIEIDPVKKSELETIINDLVQNQEKINFHGKRADAIVKGMLQHSRNSSGIKEPTDVNALADEYLRLSYHGLRAKDKSFNSAMIKDFEPNLEKITIVSQDVGRVILNLITNAFYSVTEKKKLNIPGYEPTVWVTTKKINASPDDHVGRGKVEVRVKDNGMGVPQKVMDKIFQPFFTTKPVGQGTGLGLSLSYDIIKAHGGELKLETKEGEGAEFIIQLPV
ncbi:MAG: two-component regulator propeller domain-containing protein [Sphingobacteriales bacterium]